jgi:hypothetical protein
MPVTAPFNPPSADLPGKPFVPAWDVPLVTKEKHDFAQLKSIDLSLLDSDDPAVVEALVQKVKVAIRDDGFLFLEDYGVSLDQVTFLSPGSRESHLTMRCKYSSIDSLRSRNTCTATLPTKTKNVFFSILILADGLATNTHSASR